MIESLCERAKSEIAERIETVKDHIEVLYKEMLESLRSIKENVRGEVDQMSRRAEAKCADYASFLQEMENRMANFDANRQKLEKDIYECQNYIDDLTLIEQNFNKILRKVSFEPSDWKPTETFLCQYIGKFDLKKDATKLKTNNDSDSD